MGKVHEIGMFETTILTLDNRTVKIPNSEIRIITNLSDQGIIRVDVPLRICHRENLRRAKEALVRVTHECSYVLADPHASVLVSDVDEFGRTLIMRVWLRSVDYIPGPFALREQAVLACDDA